MYDREVDVPRLLCWYAADAELPHPLLREARDQLNAHYAAELGEEFVTAGLCLYRNRSGPRARPRCRIRCGTNTVPR